MSGYLSPLERGASLMVSWQQGQIPPWPHEPWRAKAAFGQALGKSMLPPWHMAAGLWLCRGGSQYPLNPTA